MVDDRLVQVSSYTCRRGQLMSPNILLEAVLLQILFIFAAIVIKDHS